MCFVPTTDSTSASARFQSRSGTGEAIWRAYVVVTVLIVCGDLFGVYRGLTGSEPLETSILVGMIVGTFVPIFALLVQPFRAWLRDPSTSSPLSFGRGLLLRLLLIFLPLVGVPELDRSSALMAGLLVLYFLYASLIWLVRDHELRAG